MLHDLRRTVRKALETRRERIAHDRLLMDPRAATEHDMARERSLDAGHGDCPYCS